MTITKDMKFTLEEQETCLNFEAKEGKWFVYSSVPSHIRLFTKNTATTHADFEVLSSYEGKSTSVRFSIENSATSIASFIKKKRIVREPTEAQVKARQKFADKAKERASKTL